MRIHRFVTVAVLGALVFAAIGATATPRTTALAADNPIVAENQQQGSNSWDLGNRATVSDDIHNQIKGYPSAPSVSQGESLSLFITVNPAQKYTIDFYRIGWYGGLGGRLRLHVSDLDGTSQAPCVPDATTGLIECGWSPSYTLTIPGDWTSGVYHAVLTNAQGWRTFVVFVVKDTRPAAFVYQQGVTTDQAYNNYPDDGVNGKSMYAWSSYGANTIAGDKRAVKVSFDRPYGGDGDAFFGTWDIYLVRFLEKNGYDVTYTTDLDTHTNGGRLLNSRALISGGHDAYWSKEMRDSVERARDAGVNLAFIAANAVYWQVRFEASSAGVANRVMVCYKTVDLDPVQGPTTTTLWRDWPLNRPEQTLVGVQYTSEVGWGQNVAFVPTQRSHWIFDGAGFTDSDSVPGIVGYAMDRYMANYAGPNATSRTILAESPFTDGGGTPDRAETSLYQAPSGAWVFASGTSSWNWGLDNLDHAIADPRIQRTTTNLLNAFLFGAPIVDHLRVTAPATAIAGDPVSVTVVAENVQGTPVTSYSGTVHWTSSDTSSGVVLPADATLTGGQGTFQVTLTKAGAQTVTATDTQTATLTGQASLTVRAAAAASLTLAAPSSVTMNQAFNVTVTAKDRFGNLATGYTGAVHFSTSDISPLARMPADYSFAAADAGVHTFSVTLQTPPSQSVTVTDKTNAALTDSGQITVKLPLLQIGRA